MAARWSSERLQAVCISCGWSRQVSCNSGCLENFSGHRGGYRFQMHPIPEMLNPPGEPIYCVVSSALIKIVGPSFAIGFLAREHVKDTTHDRVCHSDNRPILPTPCREALIQRREIRPLGPDGGMGKLGQDGSEGAIPLAGFARALLARTFIVARSHAGPCGQTRCGFKP